MESVAFANQTFTKCSLGSQGYLVFGHDHIGHGASEGKRVYIENVEHYVDDIIEHCMYMKVLKEFNTKIVIYISFRISIQPFLFFLSDILWEE